MVYTPPKKYTPPLWMFLTSSLNEISAQILRVQVSGEGDMRSILFNLHGRGNLGGGGGWYCETIVYVIDDNL